MEVLQGVLGKVEEEEWRPVKDFEGYYEVSNLGRVRRIKGGKGAKLGQTLKPRPQHKGYLLVDLHKDGVRKQKALHRLIAETFIPNPLNLPEVNHLGTKTDCRASMLEWRSSLGNNFHRAQNRKRGVSFLKRINKWVARYSPEPGKEVWLGSFKTKEEAQAVRNAALDSMPFIL